jgi:hypothetical protein
MSRNIKNYNQYLGAQKCCDIKTLGPQGAQGLAGQQGPIGKTGSDDFLFIHYKKRHILDKIINIL